MVTNNTLHKSFAVYYIHNIYSTHTTYSTYIMYICTVHTLLTVYCVHMCSTHTTYSILCTYVLYTLHSRYMSVSIFHRRGRNNNNMVLIGHSTVRACYSTADTRCKLDLERQCTNLGILHKVNTSVYIHGILYIRKYWRSLNLAICMKSGRKALLAEFKFGGLLRYVTA